MSCPRTVVIYYLPSSLQANDIPIVSRMIVQSLLQGCPPELTEEGNQLSLLIQPLLDATSSSESATPESLTAKLNESCPACGVDVPLEDITSAVCANGHRWGMFFFSDKVIRLSCFADLLGSFSLLHSPLLGDDLYLIYTMGSNLCGMQSKGFSSAISEQGFATNCTRVGRRRPFRSGPKVSVL